jgi:hypothetical protein
MGLLRTNRRLLAGVSHRITFAAAHARVSDLARTRRGRAPSKPVLAAPDWSSKSLISPKELMFGSSESDSEALRRHQRAFVTEFVILAIESTRPSLVQLKRTLTVTPRVLARHNSPSIERISA